MICAYCEEEFAPRQAYQKFCSLGCRRADENRRRRVARKEAPPKQGRAKIFSKEWPKDRSLTWIEIRDSAELGYWPKDAEFKDVNNPKLHYRVSSEQTTYDPETLVPQKLIRVESE